MNEEWSILDCLGGVYLTETTILLFTAYVFQVT